MATLDQIVYNIADAKGLGTDPQFLERVRFNVLYYRSLLARRLTEKDDYVIPRELYQKISCIPMIKVNAMECNLKLQSCQWYMRTKHKLPKLMNLKSNALMYVGTIDGLHPYSEIGIVNLSKMNFTRYTKNNLPRYFIDDGYLYIVNIFPEKLRIVGVFEDPTSLSTVTDCGGYPIYNDGEEFPLPLDMVQQITVSLLSGELKLLDKPADEDVKVNE